MVALGESYGFLMEFDQGGRDDVDKLSEAFRHLTSQVEQRTAELQQRTIELNDANEELEDELNLRQSLEQQLVHAQKLDSLGSLAGGIAHDFNNMLYVILGCAKMALEDDKVSEPISDILARIDQAALRSKSIVDQILFFSRHETPDRKPLDVADAVQESATLLRAGLPSTMILDVELEGDCGPVLADKTQIQQLAVNLATNGFQAHSDGKGTITLTVKCVDVDATFADQHLMLEEGPYVCIAVTDRGCGIPSDILPKIYDPFFTTKPVGEGTGLGLALVHGIVTAHEGVLVIDTEVDRGTTFEVDLPTWDAAELECESAKLAFG
ncbi:MAG: ATP-binding protein [Pirellulales bacterium]|nr:ATP-binding protein [Pirellulales bacterium]